MTSLPRIFSRLLVATAVATVPHWAAAQAAGAPAGTTAHSEFVLLNGALVHRQGSQTTTLSQNVRLADGTKINVSSGIVELPGGKTTTLHEGDFVRPDGGIVFATPASAAAARGDQAPPAGAQFDKYVQVGGAPGPAGELEARLNALDQRVQLMARKVKLLNDKITILSASKQPLPNTAQLDQQIKTLDAQLLQLR